MSGAQAFVDESARNGGYYVCVAVVPNHDADQVRRLARSLTMPGQRRWHFVNERDSRRRQIIDALAANAAVQALVFHGRGRDSQVRADSFRGLVPALLQRKVGRLVIESREGRDHLDRQVLLEEIRRGRASLQYDHLPPHADPLLWVADCLAWCSSAGGAWEERIRPLVVSSHDVTRP